MITEYRPAESSAFAVCIISVPNVPPFEPALDGAPLPPGVTMHAVVAATDRGCKPDEWQWVYLTGDEKSIIGEALEDVDAKIGDWYWYVP